MKILDNMESCYGCGACYNICPTGAISMKTNDEGFLEPFVDESECISCEKCRQVCPSVNCQYMNEAEPDIYAFSAEEKILYDSSSGGIFTFLAEFILKAGGYVVGAAYDSEFCVNHIVIHRLEELDRIRRSKYLQSSTDNTYRETKILLERGERVLYSGCPCQIAGLLRFLGKEYDNLYTVDLLCHGAPSPKLFQEHLNNSFGGIENITEVEFRSREGWASLFRVKLENGDVRTLYNHNSVYMQSFLQDINLRASCFQCQYSRLPRQGNMTIGDLWAAGSFNLSFEYRKGVSVVLTNNKKGVALFHDALSVSGHGYHVQKLHGKGVEKPCNISLLNENIFHPSAINSNMEKRQDFFKNCSNMSYENAVDTTLHKFDVGLVLYMADNYGSIATNYALFRAISSKGKRVAILDNLVPLKNKAARFARKYMNLCSDFMGRNDYRMANQCLETFVVGSDQSWNWEWWNRIFLEHIQYMMLGFVDDDKRKISYAPSFGVKRGGNDISEEAKSLYSYYLKRFDAISVREDYGVDMCRDLFGVQAQQVLDPVLLCDREIWWEVSVKSQLKTEEEYLLAYILDATPQKREIVLDAVKRLNKKLIVILDLEGNFKASRKIMNVDESIVKPEFVDWLAYFRHASYVITDSLHGACFSIIFGKKFSAIKNRQKQRFDSLEKLIECPFLFYDDSAQLLGKEDIFADINYETVYKNIDRKRAESDRWLQNALDVEVKAKNNTGANEVVVQFFKSLCNERESLNKFKKDYAYEEDQKKEISAQIKAGKTWFDIVCLRNNIVSRDSKLKKIDNLYDYFAMLKAEPKYVVVLSGRDECSGQRGKFLELSGLPLRKDVQWRNSYVAVIDEGTVKIDEKSTVELNLNYEFVAGHPNYSVEYLDDKLKVCCAPLKYCKIKIKSKGFTESPGRDRSEIIVDNIDYSMNKLGTNIVVIDKETGEVVDSININTYSDPGLRINRV